MKKFADLKFAPHPAKFAGFDTQAKLFFENGYGISVVTGGYGSTERPYECAVITSEGICYSTPITDDVIGHCSMTQVNDIMKEIQELPPITA